MFTRTTQEALTRIMGDCTVLAFSGGGAIIDEANVAFHLYQQALRGESEDFEMDYESTLNTESDPAQGYVFGMGGIGGDFSTLGNNYQFGLSTLSDAASSPIAEHNGPCHVTTATVNTHASPAPLAATPCHATGGVQRNTLSRPSAAAAHTAHVRANASQ
jgi:hypothetical protein